MTDELPAPGTFEPHPPRGPEPKHGWFRILCINCGSLYAFIDCEVNDRGPVPSIAARIRCGWCGAQTVYQGDGSHDVQVRKR